MSHNRPIYSLTAKQCQIRNIVLAVCNGAVSLIILLIAPLGLAAVIVNTALIVITTYGIATLMDKVLVWLQYSSANHPKLGHESNPPHLLQVEDRQEIDRYRE